MSLDIEKMAFLASIKSQILQVAADLKKSPIDQSIENLVSITDQIEDGMKAEMYLSEVSANE